MRGSGRHDKKWVDARLGKAREGGEGRSGKGWGHGGPARGVGVGCKWGAGGKLRVGGSKWGWGSWVGWAAKKSGQA